MEVVAEFCGGFTVFLKYFDGFTVFLKYFGGLTVFLNILAVLRFSVTRYDPQFIETTKHLSVHVINHNFVE